MIYDIFDIDDETREVCAIYTKNLFVFFRWSQPEQADLQLKYTYIPCVKCQTENMSIWHLLKPFHYNARFSISLSSNHSFAKT